MIEIPKSMNYVGAFLTFGCQLDCGYCINKDDELKHRGSLSGKLWAEGLNRIDFGELPLTLEGGEPTTHRGFHTLLEELRPDINVDLLTNLQFDIDKFIDQTYPSRFTPAGFNSLPAYKSIRVSFHPTQMDAQNTVDRAARLQNAGFNIGIFSINHPHNLKGNTKMAELARQNRIYFFVKDFLGKCEGQPFGFYKYPNALDGVAKSAYCATKDILISPDGTIHRCHRDLYRNDYPVGHILRDGLVISDQMRLCDNYGLCNPCDIKARTNRFLEMGDCNVTIIERNK